MYNTSFLLFEKKITILSKNKNILDLLNLELIEKTNSQQATNLHLEINYFDENVFKSSFFNSYDIFNKEFYGINKKLMCPVFLTSDKKLYYSLKNFIYNSIENYFNKIDDVCFLHATAIEKDGFVYIILGNKNSGKSSKSIKLCLDYGYKLITDDVVPIKLLGNGNYYIEGIFKGFNMNNATYKMLLSDNDEYIDENDYGLKSRYFLNNTSRKTGIFKCLFVLDSENIEKTIFDNVLSDISFKKEFINKFINNNSDSIYKFNNEDTLTNNVKKINDIIIESYKKVNKNV
ncbi:MAG: hypothetical protein PHX46_02675 [Bacilli bacterium]|nr:hypothetical protein [Bacilli bacterium]